MAPLPSIRLPRARPRDEFLVEEMADEVLVYDNKREQAHCLNKLAALVWRHCDGRSSIDSVVKVLEAEGLPAERAIVELAVAELAKANLLVEADDSRRKRRFRSRRTMLKHLGIMAAASVALPIVQSIVAPSVAEAMSMGCVPPGGTMCNAARPCCFGTCVTGGGPPHCVP
jgi:hypothetical protein